MPQKKLEVNGDLIINYKNMKNLKQIMIYILFLIINIIVFYLLSEIFYWILNYYLFPCKIVNPTDFDCFNIINILL